MVQMGIQISLCSLALDIAVVLAIAICVICIYKKSLSTVILIIILGAGLGSRVCMGFPHRYSHQLIALFSSWILLLSSASFI